MLMYLSIVIVTIIIKISSVQNAVLLKKKVFKYRVSSQWNNLSVLSKSASSVNVFKKQFSKNFKFSYLKYIIFKFLCFYFYCYKNYS